MLQFAPMQCVRKGNTQHKQPWWRTGRVIAGLKYANTLAARSHVRMYLYPRLASNPNSLPFSNRKARISVLGWVYLDLRIIVPRQMFSHFQNESANLTTQWTATLKIPYDHHYYHTESTANTCNEPKQYLTVVWFVYIQVTSSHITQRTPTAYFLAAAALLAYLQRRGMPQGLTTPLANEYPWC